MTARHVIDNVQAHVGDNGHAAVVFGVDVVERFEWHVYELGDKYLDPDLDLAFVKVPDVPYKDHMVLDRRMEFPPNQDVITLEYSTSFWESDEMGVNRLYLTSATRKGNITARPYKRTIGLLHPTECLSLSYPALKGASGAPVYWHDRSDGEVVGMVIGNRGQELLPAHVERVMWSDGTTQEEIRYMLPSGEAMAGLELVPALDRYLSTGRVRSESNEIEQRS